MKYEAVFGNQDLFDGASKDAVIAIKRPFISGVRSEEMHFFSSTFDAVMRAGSSFNFNNVILKTNEYAERRIIQEPKRWTAEEWKDGRLPEVGSKVIFVNDSGLVGPRGVVYPERGTEVEIVGKTKTLDNQFDVVVFKWTHEDGKSQRYASSGHLEDFAPLETPEEKAQREEDEWVNKAWSETAVFAGVAQDEHDRLRIHLRHIYKAQLSGELQAPKGGE